jgi:hypothetical protein
LDSPSEAQQARLLKPAGQGRTRLGESWLTPRPFLTLTRTEHGVVGTSSATRPPPSLFALARPIPIA